MLGNLVQATICLAFLLVGYFIGTKQLGEVKNTVAEKIEEEINDKQITSFLKKTVKKEEENVYVPEDEYYSEED